MTPTALAIVWDRSLERHERYRSAWLAETNECVQNPAKTAAAPMMPPLKLIRTAPKPPFTTAPETGLSRTPMGGFWRSAQEEWADVFEGRREREALAGSVVEFVGDKP